MDPPNSLVNVSLELKVRAEEWIFCTHHVESWCENGDWDSSLEHESLDSKSLEGKSRPSGGKAQKQGDFKNNSYLICVPHNISHKFVGQALYYNTDLNTTQNRHKCQHEQTSICIKDLREPPVC
jgi:hypothetical protein